MSTFGFAIYDQSGRLVDDSNSISIVTFDAKYSYAGTYTVPPTSFIFIAKDNSLGTFNIGQSTLSAYLINSTTLQIVAEYGTARIRVVGYQ